MNSINIFITKTKLFFATYKWLLFPLIPIIIFALIIVSIFHTTKATSTLSVKQNNKQITPSPEQTIASPKTSSDREANQPYTFLNEVQDIASGKLLYTATEQGKQNGYVYPGSEFSGKSISKEILSDGSTKYEYASTDPNRPHIQIVKDGIVIFRRSLVTDTTVANYSAFITNPPYASEGSTYYGPNAVILANPSDGIAIVYNPDSNQVYEQYLFKAMDVAEFNKTFGSDITAFNPTP